tara:strand:+ start:64410 stop:64574 length:165 start_codon:yes stop_codon:yes gene_type:complete
MSMFDRAGDSAHGSDTDEKQRSANGQQKRGKRFNVGQLQSRTLVQRDNQKRDTT